MGLIRVPLVHPIIFRHLDRDTYRPDTLGVGVQVLGNSSITSKRPKTTSRPAFTDDPADTLKSWI